MRQIAAFVAAAALLGVATGVFLATGTFDRIDGWINVVGQRVTAAAADALPDLPAPATLVAWGRQNLAEAAQDWFTRQ
ncbi:hypothetical protein [Goodfellowiella coeruleoviolacea]|uniref:Uncharacterized protein n=1 Tax=Goodfellowiella coeruleoviolacea TaxID=334858 RepID=A0AAE3GD08_9PSEU|nr:hypothetical protein [Goodfellowiella coeruleoviolacea]MCP2166046.1 hypothetical protein [Goodfellowiella coeruleoviolacea]